MQTLETLPDDDSFDDVLFSRLDLQGQDIGPREFTGCTFRNCKAQELRLRNCRFEECTFEGCDLTRMRPQGMRALSIQFRNCKLMGVEFSDLGQFPRLGFDECTLQFASFVALSMRKTTFVGCRITEANFFEVDLSESTFPACDLAQSVFRDCKLRKADFSQAKGLFLDPAVNEAREAIVPLETAALLAMHHGMRVSGFGEAATSRPRRQ
ncbi:pentapeptide repeat-containing protein [Nannocystis sp. SCPEA4]|uniref:pentapeptide repeat-containing protein n=1 Tax=Nannocystis sp. SCPEA4 TaxID=2996787 RepID=UPI00227151EA|nr:pentapeptide repeat-containing protein [Nannocystis sp. SCPEA4]MCY1059496.1 pentapeptide repeat-containing protein [Nannocystis sp. SCPEA4]